MNMRKAVAAAFGAALLGAGTSAVVGGAAHGQLDTNKTGTATSSQVGTGGFTGAEADGSSGTVVASATLTSAVGAHQGHGRMSQDVHNKAHSGHANGSNHGSAKSGSQKFHIG